VHLSKTPPDAVALVGRVFTRDEAEKYLETAIGS
jgi:hypothetical protein